MPGIGPDADPWRKVWDFSSNEKRNTYMQHYGSATPFYTCIYIIFLQKSKQRLYPPLLPFACLFFHPRSLQRACTSAVLPAAKTTSESKAQSLELFCVKRSLCAIMLKKQTPASCAWSFSSEQQRHVFKIKTAQTNNMCAHICKRDAKDPAKKQKNKKLTAVKKLLQEKRVR